MLVVFLEMSMRKRVNVFIFSPLFFILSPTMLLLLHVRLYSSWPDWTG